MAAFELSTLNASNDDHFSVSDYSQVQERTEWSKSARKTYVEKGTK